MSSYVIAPYNVSYLSLLYAQSPEELYQEAAKELTRLQDERTRSDPRRVLDAEWAQEMLDEIEEDMSWRDSTDVDGWEMGSNGCGICYVCLVTTCASHPEHRVL